MRKCLKCQKEYPDHMAFCPECGKSLSAVGIRQEKFCPNCGMKNGQDSLFCENCGFSLAPVQEMPRQPGGAPVQEMPRQPGGAPVQEMPQQPGGAPVQEMPQQPGGAPLQEMPQQFRDASKQLQGAANLDLPKKSKLPLVVGLIALLVITGAAVFTGVFLAKRSKPENDTVAKEATSEKVTPAPRMETEEPEEVVDEPTPEPTPDVTAEPVDDYQAYYDGLEERFRKYIIDTAEAAKIDTYSNMLKDALTQKDAAMCGTVKKNLDKLEEQLKKNSVKKLARIKKQLTSWEKKSTSAKTKKSTIYKETKSRAKKLEKAGRYAEARSRYLECVNRLKDAKAAASKKQTTRSTDYYKPVRRDDETYELLSDYKLSKSDVARLNSEEIRYYVNTIFAVAGYRFKNPDIQEYFEYQSWYGGGFTSNQQDIIDLLNSGDGYKGTPLAYNFKLLQRGR